MNSLHRRLFFFFIFSLISNLVYPTSFKSNWSGDRPWIGPEYWANPLTDWQLEGEEVVGIAASDRTLHNLTHQVVGDAGSLEMSVLVKYDGDEKGASTRVGGFRIGNQGKLDDYRYVLIYADKWVDAGIVADGRVVLNGAYSDKRLDAAKWIRLTLKAKLNDGSAKVVLIAQTEGGRNKIELTTNVPAKSLRGNIALLSGGSGRLDRDNASNWRFKNWNISGSVLNNEPDQAWGPILWSQYSLSRNTLKLLVMMAPVDDSDEPVRLEMKKGKSWKQVDQSAVDDLSRTAIFTLSNWDDTKAVPYRILYDWKGKEYSWEGAIRPDPREKDVVSMAAFSCDNGYIFPNTRIVENVAVQDPDILFFAGDQIYESFGGFGINREPVELAMLDYLRKYWQFGWSWKDLLKDRPSIIIPDDHDVFQGNLWGQGGRRIPDMGRPGGKEWPKGGYAMDPDWINAVQRTQTGSLPDPVDPRPAGQGIGVYFTDMVYGGLHMAVLEDRKFKTGPKDPTKAEPQLLGPRQEAFLESWVNDNTGDFKVALSQTIFCNVATHVGGGLKKSGSGGDSGGWPKEKRDKALSILKDHNVIMVHGDQHLGALVHQGVDDWEDSAIAFLVPGSANGFPRAWWPDMQGENHQPGEPDWTGRYFDSHGSRMTVLAAANPEKGSNLLPKAETHPEKLGHLKGSGHGIIRFDRQSGEVTFEMWRLLFDAENPHPEDQFIGFPKTLNISKKTNF